MLYNHESVCVGGEVDSMDLSVLVEQNEGNHASGSEADAL